MTEPENARLTSAVILKLVKSIHFRRDYMQKHGMIPAKFDHFHTSTGNSTDDGFDRMRDFEYVQTGKNAEYASYSRKRRQRY